MYSSWCNVCGIQSKTCKHCLSVYLPSKGIMGVTHTNSRCFLGLNQKANWNNCGVMYRERFLYWTYWRTTVKLYGNRSTTVWFHFATAMNLFNFTVHTYGKESTFSPAYLYRLSVVQFMMGLVSCVTVNKTLLPATLRVFSLVHRRVFKKSIYRAYKGTTFSMNCSGSI